MGKIASVSSYTRGFATQKWNLKTNQKGIIARYTRIEKVEQNIQSQSSKDLPKCTVSGKVCVLQQSESNNRDDES
jgi:hypothetical protein